MAERYVFTVFTPTFNRAHTLPRVYESLERQTFQDFEWLIVDDGSADGTRELVGQWQKNATMPIRYMYQQNCGKHIAFNRAVREARGEFFLPFDSDDACVPNALERFFYHWNAIPAAAKPAFSAVTALCKDPRGALIGRRFPRDIVDSDSLEIRYRFKMRCEKWGFHRTDVLRAHPFPEAVTRQYVPESIVWSQIARRYKTRFVNEMLRIYHVDQPSMVHQRPPGRDAAGRRLAHLAVLNSEIDYFHHAPLEFCRAAGQYVRLSFHAGSTMLEQVRDLSNTLGRLLWLFALPAGSAVYVIDRHRS